MTAIKKIRVKNFKSFKDLELNLGEVNILIGANGSGKSNFTQIFKFLRDVSKEGLENAISIQSGIKYLRNINTNFSDPLSLEITYELGTEFNLPEKIIKINKVIQTFNMNFHENEGKLELGIVESKLRLETESEDIIISNIHGSLTINSKPIEQSESLLEYSFLLGLLGGQNSLIISTIFTKNPIVALLNQMVGYVSIPIYDFNPKLSKEAAPIASKADLEEDGKNLVNVVEKILDDPEKKRMFMNLVSYLLPYVKDIKVDKFTETHFYLRIKEEYSEKNYLPAPLISDGTINALGLIVALYFQESPLVIIEEPDKGFHPSLISKVVDMMKEASEYGNKQIIVTTHNPVMVKHADPKNILLVSRDEDGFSHIIRPTRKKDVKAFLENGMRLEELYVSELLEI